MHNRLTHSVFPVISSWICRDWRIPSLFCGNAGNKIKCVAHDCHHCHHHHHHKHTFQWTCQTHLDDHYLNGDMVGQSDGSTEVLGQRHQQVQDGNDALGMDRCGGRLVLKSHSVVRVTLNLEGHPVETWDLHIGCMPLKRRPSKRVSFKA